MFVAVGASLTAARLSVLLKVMGVAFPSEIHVAILSGPLKLDAGSKLTAASNALTLSTAPLAVHTPVAKVEVTPPEVPVVKVPASMLDNVSIAVTIPLAGCLITTLDRLSAVSSIYLSAAVKYITCKDRIEEVAITVPRINRVRSAHP